MSKKVPIVYFSVLSLVLFSVACGGSKDPKAGGPAAPGAAGANEVKDYPVITIIPRATTLNSDYPATIQGQQNIEIRPKIDGYIQTIFVDEGATVRKGQRLFQI